MVLYFRSGAERILIKVKGEGLRVETVSSVEC